MTTWSKWTGVQGIELADRAEVQNKLNFRPGRSISPEDWWTGTEKTIQVCLLGRPCATSVAVFQMINAACLRNGGRAVVTITPSSDGLPVAASTGQAHYDRDTGQMQFTPQDFQNPEGPTRPGDAADEALLHELVHAMLHLFGLSNTSTEGFVPPPRPDQDYQGPSPLEDLYAIVIANIYRSENGRPGLRRDHQENVQTPPLPLDLRDPAKFADLWRPQLKRLRDNMPYLFRTIAAVPCLFNPFAKV
jgi:hypothetical protein